MTTTAPDLLARYGLDRLSAEERRELIVALDKSIHGNEIDDDNFDDETKAMLIERLDHLDKNPRNGIPLSEFYAKLDRVIENGK